MLIVGADEGLFNHEEADVLMVSFIIDAVRDGEKVIRILSDDTDVFAILIFWVRKLSIKALVQMEKWDGTVLHINNIVAALGDTSLQLLGMHAVTGCDTVSYPFNKGKLTALSTLREGNFPELYPVVGEETTMLDDLLRRGQTFFLCRIVRPAKVHLFECRQIRDLHKEERKTTTCEVASSDGQKSDPSHAQSTPSNDTIEGSIQAGCPSNCHH